MNNHWISLSVPKDIIEAETEVEIEVLAGPADAMKELAIDILNLIMDPEGTGVEKDDETKAFLYRATLDLG
jgi:hypothetical protein